jgi:hypothetical protein
MIECPFCYRVFRQPPEKLGARCPKCRMPLYEDPAKRRRTPDKDQGTCIQHPEAAATTRCSRCDTPICQTCRTRWHDETVCPSCVDNSVADDEPSPLEAQTQTKQAWVSVILGLGAWMLFLLTLGPVATFTQPAGVRPTLVFLTYLCLLGSFVPGLFALGHAVAALRLRGDHGKLATGGLCFAGSQLGCAIGIILLNLWHN